MQPLPQGTGEPSQEAPVPIILGPVDLADAKIIPLLQQAYAAGQAVAITNATNDDGARLRTLLGHPNAAEGLIEAERADLIFFRKRTRPGSSAYDYSIGIFRRPSITGRQLAERRLNEYTIELLSRVFAANAIAPQASSDCSPNCLLSLADSYLSSANGQNQYVAFINQRQ